MNFSSAFDFSFSWKDLFSSEISFPSLTIGGKTASVPIVQGGMGVGISLSGLASAVAEQGGVGVIAANAIGMIEKDYFRNGVEANKRALRSEIRAARAKTDGVIGVNIMVALNDFQDMLRVSIEERADIVFLGAGLPIKSIPVKELRAARVAVVPIVSSGKAARLIFASWKKLYGDIPDGVVLEGPMAGGHLGFKPEQLDNPAFSLEQLLPEVLDAVHPFSMEFGKDIPVIAGGGVYDGADINRILSIGASGVQLGTRFVATEECDADRRFKEEFVRADQTDVVIIKSPVGMPGRAIRNQFLTDIEEGVKKYFSCPYRCLASCGAEKAQYCISLALNSARLGKMEHGFAFAGSNVWRIQSIVPVADLMAELKEGYVRSCQTTLERLKEEYVSAMERFNKLKEEYSEALESGISSLKAEYEKAMNEGPGNYFDEKIQSLETIKIVRRKYAETQEYMAEIQDKIQMFLKTVSLDTHCIAQ